MSDFVRLTANTYINLDYVESIGVQDDAATLHYASGKNIAIKGDDARRLLARLTDDVEEITVRENSGATSTVSAGISEEGAEFAKRRSGANTHYPHSAAQQAQELAKTLGSGTSRRFDFVDSEGHTREATVYREGGRWIAVVDGERYEGSNEAAAMSAAMKGDDGGK